PWGEVVWSILTSIAPCPPAPPGGMENPAASDKPPSLQTASVLQPPNRRSRRVCSPPRSSERPRASAGLLLHRPTENPTRFSIGSGRQSWGDDEPNHGPDPGGRGQDGRTCGPAPPPQPAHRGGLRRSPLRPHPLPPARLPRRARHRPGRGGAAPLGLLPVPRRPRAQPELER